MAQSKWLGPERGIDGRYIWQTKDHNYGIVVNPMAYGKNKWYVGYNYISIPNMVDLGINVTLKRALEIAKKFRGTH